MQEEAAVKAAAETTFKKDALEATEAYFENDQVKSDFTAEALKQFLAGDTAKLDKSKILVQMESDLFTREYSKNLAKARQDYINENENKGTLSWVFKSEDEINSNRMSKDEKEREYTKKLNEWESTRNSVNAPIPAFS